MSSQSGELTAGPHSSVNWSQPQTGVTNTDSLLDAYKQHGAVGITLMLLGLGNIQQGLINPIFGRILPVFTRWTRKHPKLCWMFGGLAVMVSLARYVPGLLRTVWVWAMDHALANITIEEDDKAHYDNMMALVRSKKDLSNQRSLICYSADHLKNKKGVTVLTDEKVVYQGHLGNIQFFTHNGHRFVFTHEQLPQNNKKDRGEDCGRIKIWRLSMSRTDPWWSPKPIKDLINETMEASENASRETEIKVFKASRDYWEPQAPCLYRSFESVALDDAVKKMLMDELDFFLHPDAARWYQERGREYRQGYLFHGKPGCGKTSMVRAIASHWGLSIYTISLLDKSINDENLLELFSKLAKGDIILLEDIDCAGLLDRTAQRQLEMQRTRSIQCEDIIEEECTSDEDNPPRDNTASKKSKRGRTESKKSLKRKSSYTKLHNDIDWATESDDQTEAAQIPEPLTRVTLSGLLNAIDGISSSFGHILIMTTNHPELLDPALIRPGRVERRVLFDYCSKIMVRDIFQFFYHPIDVEKCTYDTSAIPTLAEDFSKMVPDRRLSPAQVQQYLFTHRSDPQGAVDGIKAWLGELSKLEAQEAKGKQDMMESLGALEIATEGADYRTKRRNQW